MIAPGINTYFPHFHVLYDSSMVLLTIILRHEETDITRGDTIHNKLVCSLVMTLFATLECFLNELEDRIDRSGLELDYDRSDKPNMLDRPSKLYNLVTGKKINKSTVRHEDYSYVIMIRNLITHASGESIDWTSMDVLPVGATFRVNHLNYDKESFQKYKLESEVIRNKKADKIIKYLARKKMVAPYYQGRSTGWLNYISYPTVAHWYYGAVMNYIGPMVVEFSKHEDNAIKEFGIGAQRTFFN